LPDGSTSATRCGTNTAAATVSYHTKEGLLVGIGLLALAAFACYISHSVTLFWVFIALCGIVALWEVFYFRPRK
jgi:hypothetical protein